MYTKLCSRCKEDLYFEDFSTDKSSNDGLHQMCRICRRERYKERLLEEIKPILDLPTEIWKPIYSSSAYVISNLGRCKSLSRKYRWHDKLLKFTIGKRGYPVYNVDNKNRYVHRLMAIAFIPNPMNLPEVNHLDGNKLNFELSNLSWSSTKDNVIHAFKTGLGNPPIGERNSGAKLKEFQVALIFNSSKKYHDIAVEYDISINMISNIKNRKSWKHLNL